QQHDSRGSSIAPNNNGSAGEDGCVEKKCGLPRKPDSEPGPECVKDGKQKQCAADPGKQNQPPADSQPEKSCNINQSEQPESVRIIWQVESKKTEKLKAGSSHQTGGDDIRNTPSLAFPARPPFCCADQNRKEQRQGLTTACAGCNFQQ